MPHCMSAAYVASYISEASLEENPDTWHEEKMGKKIIATNSVSL